MRIGKIEGTPQEIKDMFDDQGFRFEDYLGEPYSPPKKIWVVIPICLTLLTLMAIVIIGDSDLRLVSVLYILCFATGMWSTCSIQYTLKNTSVTVIVAIGIILLILVVFQYIKPQDTIPLIKKIIG
jgi:hypothetical protein